MRFFCAVILAMVLFPGLGRAQEDTVTTAASSLQGVLDTLKQSAEKLSSDNDQWAARDKYVKAQVLQLQTQLAHLEAHGNVLNMAVVQLQDKNPRRTQQIARLEEENSQLDVRIQESESGIRSIQRSLDAGYQEDQKLLLQAKGLNLTPSTPLKTESPEDQNALYRQKEKLKLMKMIYDSQQRQELLNASILELQKNATVLPVDIALAHQQFLKEQIKDLEAQTVHYAPEGLSANLESLNQWDKAQMRQLEVELKALERNYLQLKDLMEKMSKKAQAVRMTISQQNEEEKLENSMDDLNRQKGALKADLDDLRAQMIELDKRKSYLEMVTRQTS